MWHRSVFIGSVSLFACLSMAASGYCFQQGLGYAEQLVRQGRFAAAEGEYLKILRSSPRSYLAYNDLGFLYMNQKRYPLACRQFAQAAQLAPQLPAIQQNFGMCLFRINRLSDAIQALQKAEDLDPHNLKTRYLLGYSLLFMGHPKEAGEQLEYVHEHKPSDADTLYDLVRIYRSLKENQKAINAFQELVRSHPNSVFVHILMGESYDLQGKDNLAMGEYREAISRAPDMPRLHFDLGFLLWAEGRADKAKIEFTRELKIDPNFAPAFYYLGRIALDQNAYTEAEQLFEQTLAQNRGCIDAYVGLGETYSREGDYPKALLQFDQAVRLDPMASDVHYLLASTYRRLGDNAKSVSEMRAFQRLARNQTLPHVGESRRVRRLTKTCMRLGF